MGNANSGRRPQPTALKVLRGNPSKVRINADEPRLERAGKAFDVPPAQIADDPVAAAEWARVAPILRQCGLVSEGERSALLALCTEWSRYQEAHAKVRSLGMIVKKGRNEIPIVNPYLSVSNQALQACMRLWNELGLTPSSRSRLSALPAGGELPGLSKWEGLL